MSLYTQIQGRFCNLQIEIVLGICQMMLSIGYDCIVFFFHHHRFLLLYEIRNWVTLRGERERERERKYTYCYCIAIHVLIMLDVVIIEHTRHRPLHLVIIK